MEKRKVILLIGMPASGKTTLRKELIKSNPHFVVASRDEVRKAVFSYTDENLHEYYSGDLLGVKERLVTRIVDKITYAGLEAGFDVIHDNTNLSWRDIKKSIEKFEEVGADVFVKILSVDIDVALERDSNRPASVGEEVIKKMHKRFLNLFNNKDFLKVLQEKNYNY